VPDDCILTSLGLPKVRVLDQKELENRFEITVMFRRTKAQCPRCGQTTPKVHDRRKQSKQDRAIRDKPVFLHLVKRRFRCLWCGKVFSEPDDVFGIRRRSSRRFREHLGQEGFNQTISRLARKEGVGQGLVRRCVTEEAGKNLIRDGTSETPEFIGVDEFAVKKGHIFNTVVCDIKGKRVMAVLEGKGSSRLAGYLSSLPEPHRVKAVAIDMHSPFRDAVRKSLPEAKVVADKFHVIRHFNQALDKARFSDQGEGLKTGRRRELFKNRFTLLKAEERLTDADKKKLTPIFWAYPEVRNAWQIKENLRRCYKATTRQEAELELTELEDRIDRSPFKRFKSLHPTIREWREAILNYLDYPITNGFVEGKNNRIKTIKRMAYGYRNTANLGLRILAANYKDQEAISHKLT